MKKSTKIFGTALISVLCSISAFSLDLGNLGKIGKDMDELFGDNSDLGKIYNAATEEISDEDSYYLGRSVAANLLKTYSLYESPTLESYLNKICQTLAINSDESLPYNGYHVKILDTDEINAFSTPGGHILLSRGIISCAENEDALAAIIAHEIAHVQLKHSWSTIKSGRTVNALTETKLFSSTTGFINDISSSIQNSMEKLGVDSSEYSQYLDSILDLDNLTNTMVDSLVNGYSKEAEFEADKKALELMKNAGYSPSEMVTMLKKMSTTGEFKTHPKPQDRIKMVELALIAYKTKDTRQFRSERFTKNVGNK